MNQRFVVEVEAMPDVTPAQIRMRQWLKLGLRGLKLRALRAVEQLPEEASPSPTGANIEEVPQ